MSFNDICENKILTKISRFTVMYIVEMHAGTFVCLLHSLRPSQQVFSYIGTSLPVLKQY